MPTPKRSKRLAAILTSTNATTTTPTHNHNDENQSPDEAGRFSDYADDDDKDGDFKVPPKTPSKPRNVLPRLSTTTSLRSPYPVTPSTPRYRDVFASPTTPRHVVMSAGKLFSRRAPATPMSPASLQTIYHSGRQLFARGADPGELVGRDDERQQLDAFLARLDSSNSPGGCLYVSGPPGTGKSAMVQKRTEVAAGACAGVRHLYVNCMSIKSCKGLCNTIGQAVATGAQKEDKNETDDTAAAATLQGLFVSKTSRQTYLVVLDEIDHLLTMDLESLYKLFEWSLHRHSRLALIGIANALDLMDRHLPRLKSKNLKPELLPFLPYSAPQIRSIITTRLRRLLSEGSDAKDDFVPLVHPAAIELCARKVSSQTGDLRRVFEVCRRALDMVEAETREKHETEARASMIQMTPTRKPLGENANPATSPSRVAGACNNHNNSSSSLRSISQMVAASLKALTAENAPRASIGHLNKVTAAAFSNGTSQRLKTLNLQQKAALCALIAKQNHSRDVSNAAMVRNTPSKGSLTPVGTPSRTGRGGSSNGSSGMAAPTIRMLFEAYTTLCTAESVLHPLSASEFREVVSSLETLGLVQEVDGRTGSLVVGTAGGSSTPGGRKRTTGFPTGDQRRVASCVGHGEMEQLVSEGVGEGILRSILSGEMLE